VQNNSRKCDTFGEINREYFVHLYNILPKKEKIPRTGLLFLIPLVCKKRYQFGVWKRASGKIRDCFPPGPGL
jgi:hypothetical protein